MIHRTVRSPFALLPCLLFAVLLLGGCVSGPQSGAMAAPGPGPSGQTSPTPTPPPTPTPEPPPAPAMSQLEVEYALFAFLSRCVDGLAAEGDTVRVAFDTKHDPDQRNWEVEAFSSDGNITLGTWHVQDRSTLPVGPVDSVARSIADTSVRCIYPPVLMDGEATPPRFINPAQVAAGQQSSGPIATEGLAEMRVWSEIYSCYQDFPALSSFTARKDAGGAWLVEGKSAATSYGLWEVDVATGSVTPRDDRARRVAQDCNSVPVALTAQQASVRIWIATADCFPSRPPLSVFTATQESPNRWVVEGRADGTLYGLWRVETSTGRIAALDATARNIVSQSCFRE